MDLRGVRGDAWRRGRERDTWPERERWHARRLAGAAARCRPSAEGSAPRSSSLTRQPYLIGARTDTRWAPWTVVDGNDKKAARIAALTTVADRLDAALPVDFPELDKQVAKAAKKALGWGKNEKDRAEPK